MAGAIRTLAVNTCLRLTACATIMSAAASSASVWVGFASLIGHR
jgi:hypothetical protein